MLARKTVNVSLAKLKAASFNPANRLNPSRLRDLSNSIHEIGLLYPILINEKDEIIDGHRRVQVAKEAGWDTIPAIVVDGDQARIYASINTAGRRLSGNDNLGIWLSNPDAVSRATAKLLEAMVSRVGKSLAEKMYKAGFSTKAYACAVQFARYADYETDEFIEKIIAWAIKYRQLRQLTNLVWAGQPAGEAVKAVEKNRPLRVQMAVAE